jgi:hypothetical protein
MTREEKQAKKKAIDGLLMEGRAEHAQVLATMLLVASIEEFRSQWLTETKLTQEILKKIR